MASNFRFVKAIDSGRPYKSHRYEVFGPKIRRQLCLYGQDAVNAWTLIESDASIEDYCERPILIPEAKPKRVVDFWVKRQGRDELWFMERPGEAKPLPPAFLAWAQANRFAITPLDLEGLDARRQFLKNWGVVVRYLSQNARYLQPGLIADVEACLEPNRPLRAIEARLGDEDPILVRTAALYLLHQGKVVCRTLNSQPLGPDSVLEVP